MHPRNWQLWGHRPRVITFLLTWEGLLGAYIVWGIVEASPATSTDWTRFAVLATCATLHDQLTRRQEERRRSQLNKIFVGLSGVWTFPGALLLPFDLTVLLIVLVLGQQWFNWRRPPHRFALTFSTTAGGALLAHELFRALDPDVLSSLTARNPFAEFGVLALSGLGYAGLQSASVAAVIRLSSSTRLPLTRIFGTTTDNVLDIATVGMGAVTAVLLVYLPPAVVVVLLASVLGNRLAEISQLQDAAQTDVKTGLLNMRGWTDAAERAAARARRAGDSMALLMIDLDHFKWINDTYGHPAGDDVLEQVGQLLTKAVRPTDIVGRFGGEEFVVLLLDTDRVAAAHAAERIRSAIANAHIHTTGRRGSPVTITDRTTSVGISVHGEHGTTLDELLHAADEAVYEAKDHGRDKVRFAPTKPLPTETPRIKARHP
jgi:diguanylate cyclase (GGDEF)-like protein